jgi:hypothetical protein
VKKIEDLFSFEEDDVVNLCKLIRKDNKPFPFVAEKNLKLVVSEAQIVVRRIGLPPKCMALLKVT